MIGLRNKYCLSFFKAILVAVGLIFLLAQSSFKFYQFASYPISTQAIKVASNGSISAVRSDFLKYGEQAKLNLLLDKRYDLKHIFFTPVPIYRPAILSVQRNQYLYIFTDAYS